MKLSILISYFFVNLLELRGKKNKSLEIKVYTLVFKLRRGLYFGPVFGFGDLLSSLCEGEEVTFCRFEVSEKVLVNPMVVVRLRR